MASANLFVPTGKTNPISLLHIKPSPTTATYVTSSNSTFKVGASSLKPSRREFSSLFTGILLPSVIFPLDPSLADSDEEYVKETTEMIIKLRSTMSMDRNDPNVAPAVADLRESSNNWVAKYRREKSLLGRASFRDMYSALNAVSGHYISFGPTAPIPAKRKARILEELDTAEKSLLRGR